MKKAVLMLSGGPDSTSLAYWIKKNGYELHTLTFNFGEAEGEAERRTAQYFANKISKTHKFVSFEAQLKEMYPAGDPIHILRKVIDDSMQVKPFGAGIALSLAASYAVDIGASDLFYAVHKDDSIYRENNNTFFRLLSEAISIETGQKFEIHTPFLDKSKAEVFKIGNELGVLLEETWSCASNSTIHCGTCEPCRERQNAFKAIDLVDNTLYQKQVNSATIVNV
jgi:7-cyano-7-deazaguanine synthase